MQILIFIVSLILVGRIVYTAFRKKFPLPQPGIETEKQILLQYVGFYKQLNTVEKKRFEGLVQQFLQKVRITGVNTMIADMDYVFIAASAIIPIFAFQEWEYTNIHEVLLYPDLFDKDFHIKGNGRDTLGMVGDGPMQNVMILSKQDLRNGFLITSGKSNTAIHEFVHLIDKSDGDTDGLPRILLQHRYVIPWLKRMHQEILQIKSGKSDINPYGATSEAEFLAVTAEYFFTQPLLLKQKHPDLFNMLQQIFTASVPK